MKKDYTIAVAGTGYVGLSIATLLSQHHKVMAVDIVKEKVDLINNRKSPIQDDYIEKYLAEKDLNLTATLDREIWFDPLGKLLGGWGLYEDGEFTTESIENFMLFVPFSILLLWAFQKELLGESENIRFGKTVWEATKVVAVFSFLIEFTQLLFHLGTFQISDLTYNTLGGAVGGVIYYLGYSRKRKK